MAVSCAADRGVGAAAGETDAAASGLTDGNGAAGLGTALTAGEATGASDGLAADAAGALVGGGALDAAGALVGVGGACEHPAIAAAARPAIPRATNRWRVLSTR